MEPNSSGSLKNSSAVGLVYGHYVSDNASVDVTYVVVDTATVSDSDSVVKLSVTCFEV